LNFFSLGVTAEAGLNEREEGKRKGKGKGEGKGAEGRDIIEACPEPSM